MILTPPRVERKLVKKIGVLILINFDTGIEIKSLVIVVFWEFHLHLCLIQDHGMSGLFSKISLLLRRCPKLGYLAHRDYTDVWGWSQSQIMNLLKKALGDCIYKKLPSSYSTGGVVGNPKNIITL